MNTINAEEILIPLMKCRCRSFSRIFPAQTQSPIQTRSHLATSSLENEYVSPSPMRIRIDYTASESKSGTFKMCQS